MVTVFLIVLGTLTPTGECGVVKRQAFDTFGNVFHSFGELINEPWQPFIPPLLSYIFVAVNLFSTLGQEGGKFVSKQVEVNQPVVETVGNIQSTIRRYNLDINNLFILYCSDLTSRRQFTPDLAVWLVTPTPADASWQTTWTWWATPWGWSPASPALSCVLTSTTARTHSASRHDHCHQEKLMFCTYN